MRWVRKYPLFCILGFGLALRLIVLWRFAYAPQHFFSPDSGSYLQPAINILHHGAFSISSQPPFVPYTLRTPFYSFYIAFWYRLLGENPFFIILTQIGLGLVTIYLTWRLTSEWFHPYGGYWAALILACNPNLIFLENRILTETVSAFLQLACIYFGWVFIKKKSFTALIVSGLVMGITALTRPFSLYYFPIPLLFIAWGNGKPWKKSIWVCCIWFMAFLVPIGGWTLRNWVQTGRPIFCAIGGYNLLETRAAHIYQFQYTMSLDEAIQRLYGELKLRGEGKSWTESDYAREARNMTGEILRAHPFLFLRCCMDTLPALFFWADNSNYNPFFHKTDPAAVVLPRWEKYVRRFFWTASQQLFLWWILGCAGLGSVWLIRRKAWNEFLLLVLSVVYPAIILLGASTGMPRYRAPYEPYLAILSGVGIAVFAFRLSPRSQALSPLPLPARTLVCLPVFNEEKKITQLLDRFPFDVVDRVVVVDDGSADGTETIVHRYPIEVIRHTTNLGVGSSIRDAIVFGRKNDFQIIVVMAGNGKDDPNEIPKLLHPLLEKGTVYVQGSRFNQEGGRHINTPLFRLLTIKLYSWIFNLLSPSPCTDLTNGFRAYRLDLFDDPRINIHQSWLDRYELEYYIHFKAIMLGYPVDEVPVTKSYPSNKRISYTKIRSWVDWWKMIRPMVYLFLRIKY